MKRNLIKMAGRDFATSTPAAPQQPRFGPPGWTLIEMLVVLTVAAVMMGLGVTTIHLLLGSEHEAMKSVRYSASVTRLTRVFREDVHMARRVEIPPVDPGKPSLLVATIGDNHQVRYELDAHVVTRIETGSDDGASRDVFYFPPQSRLRCWREGEAGPIRLEIDIAAGMKARPKAAAPQPTRTVAIEAVPARDHRFEKSE